jgi:aspartokinase
MAQLIVQKYGGSSVADPEKIKERGPARGGLCA